ncbi:MAG: hypothetical protein D6E12_09085 [Desulfovibrio sp.]|nr:MAG: hypothetical protein D6E12_09085 [Desulfovibrio sp.]
MEAPKWAAKNPLGILALFIFLIYSVSSLLFALSAEELGSRHKEIVIWFITLFPLLVLIVFYRLVSKHHEKLYAPKDYKQAGEFGKIALELRGREFARKYPSQSNNELNVTQDNEGVQVSGNIPFTALELTSDAAVVFEPQGSLAQALPQGKISFKPELAFGNDVVRAYVAESLAFQDLQERLQGAVMRQVRFQGNSGRSLPFDGLIESAMNTVLVDVTIVREKGFSVAEAAGRLLEGLNAVAHRREWTAVRAVFIYDLGYEKPDAQERDRLCASFSEKGVDLVFYTLAELVEKFGFVV